MIRKYHTFYRTGRGDLGIESMKNREAINPGPSIVSSIHLELWSAQLAAKTGARLLLYWRAP